MALAKVMILVGLCCLTGATSSFLRTRPVEHDSEDHIPVFRGDGTLDFISSAPEANTLGSIDIEVPRDFSKFMEGLMWRRELDDRQGMIFQWDEDGPRGFWMENTYIGLDIVYVDHNNRIVSIGEGAPLSKANIPSALPAKYAVEVSQGWCKRHGVGVGDHINFQVNSDDFYVARDMPAFGATSDELRLAREEGNYQD